MGDPEVMFTEEISKGGLVYCLDDLEDVFTVGALEVIEKYFNNGYSVEALGDMFNRDPDEIFIAVFHLARQGKIYRKMAYRFI